ncbi:hypothetical protein BDQ12DRAFT_606166 [Crucibulum laeve]|uniref:DUF6534 domain-containing protein n=1 Tax=Crucibulum laeve TaxID=68775 RepID=A0A5C3MBC6_9AGAR|nr:hypothetical protein BDQ12DRAFT_606166 [Crucibulum laeve]
MSSVNQLEGIDLSGTFAPVYWGFVISLLLGGITVVQAYIYFPRAKDKIGIQLTVSTSVLDLVSSFLVAYSIYYYLIPRFGSLVPLNSVTPELSAECLVSTAITLISQMYFVYQLISVKRLGKGSWIVICILIFYDYFAVGGIACVATMYIFQHGVLSNRNNTFSVSVFFGVAKGFGAATDILATIAMCVFLTSSKTGMKQTNSMLKALIQFIIHRGALVTLIQTLLLITFYAIPRSLVWLAFHVNVTKLYANTFCKLNGREHLKERHLGISTNISSTHFAAVRDNTKSAADQDEHYNMQQMEVSAVFNNWTSSIK